MSNTNTIYKEIPNQNFIEVKINSKNIREISKDEALQRYKKNAYIIGRIFSYNQESALEDIDDHLIINEKRPSLISNDMIKQLEDDLEIAKKRQQAKIDEYKERNKEYLVLMNDIKNIKTHKELDDILIKMKNKGFYSSEHPFLFEGSPFYKNTDDSIIKRVDPIELNIPPTWDITESISLYQL